MRIVIRVIAATLLVNSFGFSVAGAAPPDEVEIMKLILPPLFSRCVEGDYEACKSSLGCRRMDAIWSEGSCRAKPQNRKLTEELAGGWRLLTLFPSGHHRGYFWMSLRTIKHVAETADFSIHGESHLSDQFITPLPDLVGGAYDSTYKDWFFLEVWGRDQGLASFYEFEFTTEKRISGCQYYVTYPELLLVTGICNSFSGARFISLNPLGAIESGGPIGSVGGVFPAGQQGKPELDNYQLYLNEQQYQKELSRAGENRASFSSARLEAVRKALGTALSVRTSAQAEEE